MVQLADRLRLPCGAVLRNRIVKAAMSDDLGNGRGQPTSAQARLYGRWAEGGVALSLVGETQIGPQAPENYGNLVLEPLADPTAFKSLTKAGTADGAHLWAQLGHAGILAVPVAGAPKGPSAIDFGEIHAEALSEDEVEALPGIYARAAANALSAGFTGVEVHAAHGFLLSQFLSPLVNKRTDRWGGAIEGRARLLLDIVGAVRAAVGNRVPVAVKINATDQLEGGLAEAEALDVIGMLEELPIDLIDISGGAYFPGAAAASDSAGQGPYFLRFAEQARKRTQIPLMSAGGFKHLHEAEAALAGGALDLIGLARALVLAPDLPKAWIAGRSDAPEFPRFKDRPEGGVTAWYTERIRELGGLEASAKDAPLSVSLEAVAERRAHNRTLWMQHFGAG